MPYRSTPGDVRHSAAVFDSAPVFLLCSAMPCAPPFDRAIALACTMATLRGRWIFVRCGCGASQARPVRMMLAEQPAAARQTLADLVVHLRCHECGDKPAAVHLAADAHGPGPISGRPEAGWAIELHTAPWPSTG